MGSVFARGLLRSGHPVVPVTRDTDINSLANELPDPLMVLIAVAEADIHNTLNTLPAPWRDRVALLQNELLPRDWEQFDYKNPTVISVWFEKKKGQDSKVIIPSPVYGPLADTLSTALNSIDISSKTLKGFDELVFELMLKNIYIVTTNTCGLVTGGTVGELWENNEALAREVAGEIMAIQQALTSVKIDNDLMIDQMLLAFKGDLDHKCMGRSAPGRLQRALQQAKELGVEVPALERIAATQ